MRDDSISPSGDWVGWREIVSTVTDADLNTLERETGLNFPPMYRDFLRYRHFVELSEVGVRFERHLSTSGLRSSGKHTSSRGRVISSWTLAYSVSGLRPIWTLDQFV